jgi:hypothetical protein
MAKLIANSSGTCNHTGSGSAEGTLDCVNQSFVKIDDSLIMIYPDTMEVDSHIHPGPISVMHSYIPDVTQNDYIKVNNSIINVEGDNYEDDYTVIDNAGQGFVYWGIGVEPEPSTPIAPVNYFL